MPCIAMHLDEEDFGLVKQWLSGDEEIAYIVADGPGRWRAGRTIAEVADHRFCLWHIPSGSLPLLTQDVRRDEQIANPWAGWTELRGGADPSVPYFGAGHVGIIWLIMNIASKESTGGIGLSAFEWIGNRYSVIGKPAPKATHRWWNRLKGRVQRAARLVPRNGPINGAIARGGEVWAFPSAYRRLVAGENRDFNP